VKKERILKYGRNTVIVVAHFSKTSKETAVDKYLQYTENFIKREIDGKKLPII
jgi:hypothetical protein